jgi:hypothetical protein
MGRSMEEFALYVKNKWLTSTELGTNKSVLPRS